LVKIGKELRT